MFPPPPYTWLMTTSFGGGVVFTVRLIEPLPVRAWASVIVKGSDLAPGVVVFETVAVKVNVLPLPEND